MLTGRGREDYSSVRLERAWKSATGGGARSLDDHTPPARKWPWRDGWRDGCSPVLGPSGWLMLTRVQLGLVASSRPQLLRTCFGCSLSYFGGWPTKSSRLRVPSLCSSLLYERSLPLLHRKAETWTSFLKVSWERQLQRVCLYRPLKASLLRELKSCFLELRTKLSSRRLYWIERLLPQPKLKLQINK